jgi:hypothetical protein
MARARSVETTMVPLVSGGARPGGRADGDIGVKISRTGPSGLETQSASTTIGGGVVGSGCRILALMADGDVPPRRLAPLHPVPRGIQPASAQEIQKTGCG